MRSLTATLIGAALFVTSQLIFAQSDFEKYVEEIRKAGMTEDAAVALQTAAGILSGVRAFEVKRAPDRSFQRSYSSTMCFRPGADKEKLRALRYKIEAKQEEWVRYLKKHADTDGSGFVNTAEGEALRRRVELGLLLAQVTDIKNVDDLVEDLQQDRAQVVGDLAAYAKLQADSVQQGMKGLPALPKILLGAV